MFNVWHADDSFVHDHMSSTIENMMCQWFQSAVCFWNVVNTWKNAIETSSPTEIVKLQNLKFWNNSHVWFDDRFASRCLDEVAIHRADRLLAWPHRMVPQQNEVTSNTWISKGFWHEIQNLKFSNDPVEYQDGKHVLKTQEAARIVSYSWTKKVGALLHPLRHQDDLQAGEAPRARGGFHRSRRVWKNWNFKVSNYQISILTETNVHNDRVIEDNIIVDLIALKVLP